MLVVFCANKKHFNFSKLIHSSLQAKILFGLFATCHVKSLKVRTKDAQHAKPEVFICWIQNSE